MGLPAERGRLCISRAGRDKGRCFMILEVVSDEYVLIADGVMRKLAAPKKKKLKHLDIKPEVLTTIAEKLWDGRKVFDSEVRSAIHNSETVNGKREG